MPNNYEQYFKILDLDIGASKEDVKIAFRELSQIWHPDKHLDKSLNVQNRASEKFKEITSAYQILTDYLSAEEKKKAEQDRRDREENARKQREEKERRKREEESRRKAEQDRRKGGMKKCSSCEQQNPNGAHFCIDCGKAFSEEKEREGKPIQQSMRMVGLAMVFIGFIQVFLSANTGAEITIFPMLLYFSGLALWAHSSVKIPTVRYLIIVFSIMCAIGFIALGEVLFWHKYLIYWGTIAIVGSFMFPRLWIWLPTPKKTSNTLKMRESSVKRFWSGNVPLWKSFWLVGGVGTGIVKFIFTSIPLSISVLGPIPINPFLLGWGIFVWVGIWRASGKYQGNILLAYAAVSIMTTVVVFSMNAF